MSRARRLSAAVLVACMTTAVNLLVTVPLVWLDVVPAVVANTLALALECPLAYTLLRRYVWKAENVTEIKRARSAFVLLYSTTVVLSSVAVAAADHLTQSLVRAQTARTLAVLGAQWLVFCVLWALEFTLLDTAVFRSKKR
jgi:putative flippase GtrA